jgi:hypothetical protein
MTKEELICIGILFVIVLFISFSGIIFTRSPYSWNSTIEYKQCEHPEDYKVENHIVPMNLIATGEHSNIALYCEQFKEDLQK